MPISLDPRRGMSRRAAPGRIPECAARRFSNERTVRRASSPATCAWRARRRADAAAAARLLHGRVSLFPLGVGPEPQTAAPDRPRRRLGRRAAGVDALGDAACSPATIADGSLEQMLLSGRDALAARSAAPRRRRTGSLTGLPLVVVAPLFGLLFDLRADALGALVAVAAAGHPGPEPARRPGRGADAGPAQRRRAADPADVPLCDPGADLRRRRGRRRSTPGCRRGGHFSLLGALLILTALLAPLATAAALRIATGMNADAMTRARRCRLSFRFAVAARASTAGRRARAAGSGGRRRAARRCRPV